MPSERNNAKSSMSAPAFICSPIHGVGEAHDPAVARHAKAQRKRFSSGRTPVALFARKFAHAGIEQPRPLRSRPFAVSCVRGREIAVGETFLKDGLRHLPVQISALGLLIFFVPAQAEPFQSLENRIDRGVGIAFDVGIVEPQNHRSVVPACVEPVEDECAGAAHVEKAGGRGRKTHSRLVERR